MIYTATILFVKLSILTYYVRIFSVRPFRIAAYAVGSIVVIWAIVVWFISIFSCRPINGFWDKSITTAHCVNSKKFYIGNAVPNIFTDVMILILPVRMVWGLQTNRMQKITLSFIFLLGGLYVSDLYNRPMHLETDRFLVWWFAVAFDWRHNSKLITQILLVSFCERDCLITIANKPQGP